MIEVGDTIKGYKIIQNFTTDNGGLSRWTFAEKDGKIFFLKEFLAPKYPKDDSPGSEKVKAQRRKRCERFEHHHKALKRAIDTSVGTSGNLVTTIDFFRHGTTYYKVTEKVDISSNKFVDISQLPIEQRILVLKTVAHSLMVLHQLNIVHGDLKPDNILIKQTKMGDYVAKLIDFDNSYFSKEPPEISDESDIVSDPVYYSPELGKYIKQDSSVIPSDLYTSSDIFALGLIYSQYLTGKLPKFSPDCRYAWESANIGIQPHVDEKTLPDTLKKLVNNMLEIDPKKRPTIRIVFQMLKNWDKIENTEESLSKSETTTESRLHSKSSPNSEQQENSPNSTTSRLQGKMHTEWEKISSGVNEVKKEIKKKVFKVSVAHPKLISKGVASPFVIQLYFDELLSKVKKRNLDIAGQDHIEHTYDTKNKVGQSIKIKLFSTDIVFPEPVVKKLNSSVNSLTFLGKPLDTCYPREHKIVLSILDNTTGIEYQSETFSVKVVDFAFDHISRPLLSKASTAILGVASFSMFVLTFLEQIDKTVGLTSGTATGVLAMGLYASFYNLYLRIHPNTP